MTTDELITLRRADVQALLDVATASMDFGSGFWDTEEANAARAVAVALGIDPDTVTPSNLLANTFRHTFAAETRARAPYPGARPVPTLIDSCKLCHSTEGSVIHRKADQ